MSTKQFIIGVVVTTLLLYLLVTHIETDTAIQYGIKPPKIHKVIRNTSLFTDKRQYGPANITQGNDDRKSVPLRKLTDSKSMPPYLLWDHRGRLGNNIFEYASSYCIAIHSNHIPTISNDSRLLNLFKGIKAVKISRKFRRQNLTDATTVHEKGYAIHNSNLTTEIRYISSPVRTDGYLQSHKYFSKCNTDIKQQFTFVDDLQDDVHQIMVTIVLKHLLEQNYISIHDMDSFLENKTVPQEITYIGVHCRSKLVFDIDYLPRAMNYFRKKYKNVLFLLCTDTPTWVQSFLQNQLQHNDAISVSVETSTYKEDFGILVNCNHSLITGGTFSWWSGWLAGGEVVYPKAFAEWHVKHQSWGYIWEDYYPDHWRAM